MGRGRAPCCDKTGLKKGPWSTAEDLRLIAFIQKHGHDNWRALPKQAGLLRCGKSCRLRWTNYLRPDIKRGNFTSEEEETIIKLHNLLGNKWSKIASHLRGRTDNEIKNVWNTHLKKRLISKGSDSSSNNPKISSITSSSTSSCSSYTDQLVDGSRLQEEKDPLEEMLEIPLEPNFDFWDITEDESFFLTSRMDPVCDETHQHSTFQIEYEDEIESKRWVKYLENELGLEKMTNQEILSSSDELQNTGFDPIATYFQLWPSSPHNCSL